VEEARACAALAEELGLTREEIGRRVGRSRVAISNLVRLLELPDDVLELLMQGALSEGHGRALLMAEDHETRRRLARAAVGEAWSVRTTERRAREANESAALGARERAEGSENADRDAGTRDIAETLEAALGAEVRVRCDARGRYTAQLSFASHEEALALARRLRPRSVA
jgi:ParB family chromosome partitioning protein